MKYKVGDKVRVRNDLVFGKKYGKCTFVVGMDKYSGKIMTIGDINLGCYNFIEDTGRWCWTDEMLETEGYKQILELLEELLERKKATAKYFVISLAEFDHRDYEWLVKQVTEEAVGNEYD